MLGDAAHPMLPYLAQGAAQAIEDAAALAKAFTAYGSDTVAALAAYAQSRAERAGRVQLAARRQGAIYHMSGAGALARDIAIRLMGVGDFLGRYDWLYGQKP